MPAVSGCKKDGQEEPVVIYYSQEQQEPGTTVTLQNTDTTVASEGTGEILAPVIAGQSEAAAGTPAIPSQSAAVNPGETVASQTVNPGEETTAATTAGTTDQTTEAVQGDSGEDAQVPSMSSGSHIYDDAGVIADEGAVNAAMSSFESNTGVSPAIFTISDQLSGDDFRQYARDVYSSNFNDQDHVVIVYQMTPAGTWSWTCVFGTNTGTVFTQDNIDTFQSDLTDAFSSSNVDNALESAFNNAQNAQS
jgi:hypothetical protein